ncbi:hypothetical protein LshimejAT787_1200690 [Lyophyllum shimeji]|uniref:Uncharacterized protein n=1 Tax=Lyophyllum shimeji TaxID=47721 RepID=A0A9P3PV71_LYOSH|nr:hypothetical protein LshimejAT787_1200690 [Lyophyllum shimeji]
MASPQSIKRQRQCCALSDLPSIAELKMHFSRILLLVSLAVSGFATTVSDVQNHIDDLSSQINDIHAAQSDILHSDGANVGVVQGLKIHSMLMKFAKSQGLATDAVKALSQPATDDDCRAVLASIGQFEPLVSGGSAKLVDNTGHSIFSRTGARPVFKRYLNMLHARTATLSDALVNAAPPNCKSDAIDMKNKFERAFTDVKAAYQ